MPRSPRPATEFCAEVQGRDHFFAASGKQENHQRNVRIMRATLKKLGAPEDIFQVHREAKHPPRAGTDVHCDLTIATGGPAMVKAAYSSGKPAYGVGAGNATMVIDETANIEEAARNTRISKTSDYGSGCSADGNWWSKPLSTTISRAASERRRLSGLTPKKSNCCKKRCGMPKDTAPPTRSPAPLQRSPRWPDSNSRQAKTFLIVKEDKIGKEHLFSSEKLSVVLSIFKYSGFENALEMVKQIYAVGGRGHSCGIYSFNDEHIHQLALVAPVSRMMVRQPQSKANSGSFTNGMAMTSSMGCGIWGGNITNENITLKHYMQSPGSAVRSQKIALRTLNYSASFTTRRHFEKIVDALGNCILRSSWSRSSCPPPAQNSVSSANNQTVTGNSSRQSAQTRLPLTALCHSGHIRFFLRGVGTSGGSR